MKKICVLLLALPALSALSQNDLDAIRMSRAGQGGTSRALAMGGAFGALGADVSTSAFNPAGLALFRKGELSFSGGLRFIENSSTIYNERTAVPDLRFVFNNFGLALAWDSGRDPESRHALAFSSTQVQNFGNKVRMSGYTNNASLAKEWYNIAASKGTIENLDYAYEGLAYDSYLLDYDPDLLNSGQSPFISLVDMKRSVRQTRDLIRSGRMNDVNISYAYSYKDKYYIGASLGLPRVDYSSTTTHREFDDLDSMRITFDPQTGNHSHTYIDDLPSLDPHYREIGGFHSFEYSEYFRTVGTGYNLKIGGIARINDMLRLGMYYHTPTMFRLSDTYYNELLAYFDYQPSTAQAASFPADNTTGRYNYRIFTPSRLGFNTALIFGKRAAVAVDYEMINYRRARLSTDNIDDFADVNDFIRAEYGAGHNVKAGVELNFSPIMVRAGYAMLGSPYGEVFTGPFVRHTVSAGLGLRTSSKLYIDLVWLTSFSQEDYLLYRTMDVWSDIRFFSSTVGMTAGLRF